MLNDRLFCELALLEEYKNIKDYLENFEIIQDDPLKVRLFLSVKNHRYIFIAIFNKYFPYQPIEILAETKFPTGHMYKNGAMCLTHGQDNWNKDIKLVNLIDDLYNLLFTENPLGNEHNVAPSGDKFTLGQLFRNPDAKSIILPIEPKSIKARKGSLKINYKETPGILFVYSINDECFYNSNVGDVCQYLIVDDCYNDEDEKAIRNKYGLKSNEEIIVIFTNDIGVILFENSEKIHVCNIYAAKFDVKNRINIPHNILCKKITIIGLGSVGSRVAVDLARAGFTNFLFVDEDLFLPHNIVRHELDARDYGDYKIIALKKYIQDNINKNIKIDTLLLAMTGQESSTSTDRFLKNCENSLLIIDCTGCDAIFFTLNKLVVDMNIPFISGTVIPGGLGNVVLVRKKDDISLESLLASYYYWNNDMNIFAQRINDYESSVNEQSYTATMSDCSILSGFVGKIAIDLLSDVNNSVSNINVFSTSDYRDLREFYNVYKYNANSVIKDKDEYDEILVEQGKVLYENYCSSKNNK